MKTRIFGTNKPLKSFRGKAVAVWHRFDDVEDKQIVSLNGEDIAEEKILGDISRAVFLWEIV